MHIYAFGSICRGDVDALSDIDMLAIVDGRDARFNPNDYSIYSYSRILELWQEGNPFAWHLHLESRLIYAADNIDYLKSICKPDSYKKGASDCNKFYDVFVSAKTSIEESSFSEVFDLSSVFLGIRNFATCYSLHTENPDFSRNAAFNLGVESVPIDKSIYRIFERARILSTRGMGENLSSNEIMKAKNVLGEIDLWMRKKLELINNDQRIE